MKKANLKFGKLYYYKFFYLVIAFLITTFPVLAKEAQQKNKQVSGVVTDTGGIPLAGVYVIIPNTSTGTFTDGDGKYSLTVPDENVELQFSYIGFQNQTVKVGTRKNINITLSEDINVIEDVVVVGYSTQKKATVTGAVAAVNTSQLLQSPQANISNSLAGRMPGLLAVQRSGEPGKDASTLRIRGIGSFATAAAGQPDPQDPLIMVDGIEATNYNSIDPNEIESITILKDASATAVYGVRGANGVLLITTRRGETGKPKVSLSSSVAVSNFPFLKKNMNSYEYATAYNQGLRNDSYVTGNYYQKYSEEEIQKYKDRSDPIFYPDIDWYDYLLKNNSLQTKTNLNIRGGTERVKYFFSIGYFTQEGMLNTSVYDPGYDYQIKYKRYNLRSNFDIDVTRNLKASFDLATQIDDSRGPNWDTGLFMEMLSSIPSLATAGVIDNKIVNIPSITQSTGSPVTPFNKGWHRDYGNNIEGSVRLTYKMDYLLKGLSLRGAISYKNYNTDVKTYEQMGIAYEARRLENGEIVYIPDNDPDVMKSGSRVEKNRRIYLEGGIEYIRSFGYHNVSGLLLYNQSKYHDKKLQYMIPNGYQGIAGRVTYNFKNKYLAEFNIGYNGTENFAKGRRFGTFPAFSLGWVATEESFFPKNDYLTFMKIRGSYGVVGNDKIGGDRFLYLPTSYLYTGDSSYYFGEVGSSYQGYTGSNEGKLGNPLLTWEKAKKLNIGTDIKFWNDKIGLGFDYFEERRDNILWNRGTVPAIIGANLPAYNLGEMKNSGFEVEVTYNDNINEFNYFVKANYTYAHNVIRYQDEVQWQHDYQFRTGNRFGQFFGYVADGLYNTWEEVNDINRPVYIWNNNKVQPGDIRYKDINGDGKIDSNDQVPIGYANFPEVVFGLSLGGEYKGFDFSLLFQGATKVSNLPSRRTMRGFYEGTGANRDLLKSWSQERYETGQEIRYPRIAITNSDHNYVTSTFWLEDASYVRLKNAEVGYTFRGKRLEKVGMGSLRLYVNGNNLLTWCNLLPGEDPEFPTVEANSEPYPVMRTFNFGFNINF